MHHCKLEDSDNITKENEEAKNILRTIRGLGTCIWLCRVRIIAENLFDAPGRVIALDDQEGRWSTFITSRFDPGRRPRVPNPEEFKTSQPPSSKAHLDIGRSMEHAHDLGLRFDRDRWTPHRCQKWRGFDFDANQIRDELSGHFDALSRREGRVWVVSSGGGRRKEWKRRETRVLLTEQSFADTRYIPKCQMPSLLSTAAHQVECALLDLNVQ
ncbi:hypothetical protein DFH09DRAFT_1075261 [Mycena vulgaris]|nr:hypothetical protein DFH09DRAFT_1075261 [Mycena vulgaris]